IRGGRAQGRRGQDRDRSRDRAAARVRIRGNEQPVGGRRGDQGDGRPRGRRAHAEGEHGPRAHGGGGRRRGTGGGRRVRRRGGAGRAGSLLAARGSQTLRTFAAWAPLGPWTTSNCTCSPSASDRNPSDWMAV